MINDDKEFEEQFDDQDFPEEDFGDDGFDDGLDELSLESPDDAPVDPVNADPVNKVAEDVYAEDEFGSDDFGADADDFAEDDFGAEDFGDEAFEDDFGGDEELLGEDEYGDEEWADEDPYAEGEAGQVSDAAKEKKKKLTNLVVLGVAGIVGLGVMYMQMGGGGGTVEKPPVATQKQPAAQQQAQNQQDTKQPENDTGEQQQAQNQQQTPDKDADNGKPEGLLFNPEGYKELSAGMSNADDEDFFPETTGEDADGKPKDVTNVEQPIKVEGENPPAMPSDSLGDEDEKTIIDTPDEVAQTEQAQTQTSTVDAAVLDEMKAAMAAQTSQMTKALDKTQKSLSEITQQLEKVADRMDDMDAEIKALKAAPKVVASKGGDGKTVVAAGGVSSEDLAKIEEAIIYLDQQMQDAMEKQDKKIESFQTAQNKKLASLTADLKEASSSQKTLPQPSTPAKIIEVKPNKPTYTGPKTTSAETPKKAAPKVSAGSWILKAATPGEAYVLRRGRSDILQVTVGDNLPGIGRISSISKQNNRWVVQGSYGSIKQ